MLQKLLVNVVQQHLEISTKWGLSHKCEVDSWLKQNKTNKNPQKSVTQETFSIC